MPIDLAGVRQELPKRRTETLSRRTINVARVRQETPGCEHVLHFNNAGAALMPQPVIDTCLNHLQLEARIGGYEAAEQVREQCEAAYETIASLLNASPGEIALTDSATRAWNLAFGGLCLPAKSTILTFQPAYASNFIGFLHRAKRDGVEIHVIPSDARGSIDMDALERRIDERTALIALTHVATNGGPVHPAEAVGAIARAHHIPYLLDACQSVGHVPIDTAEIGCDMLSATGRKYLRGPRGTGFLYVRQSFLERLDPPTPDLHSATWTSPETYRLRDDARRFELWECNVASTLGLGRAAAYTLEQGIHAIHARISHLADLLRRSLDAIDTVRVRSAGAATGSGIVSFEVLGVPAFIMKKRLREQSINVSVSVPSSTLLDAQAHDLPNLVRASVHYYNVEEEIHRFCKAIRSTS